MARFGESGGPQLKVTSSDGSTESVMGLNTSGKMLLDDVIMKPVEELSADPETPANGDTWYNTTDDKFKGCENGKKILLNGNNLCVALTDAANISWDYQDGFIGTVTLAGNRTLDDIGNLEGGTFNLIVKQDATGSRTLAYGSAYKFEGGTPPTLSTAANAVDVLEFVSDGTDIFYTKITKNLT